MCSYQRVNQTFSCENSKILNGILKTEFDFQGFIVSDWAALESGVNSALAGTDMVSSYFSCKYRCRRGVEFAFTFVGHARILCVRRRQPRQPFHQQR